MYACVGMYMYMDIHVQGVHACEGCTCIPMGAFVWCRSVWGLLMYAQHVWRALGRPVQACGIYVQACASLLGSEEGGVGAVHVGGVCVFKACTLQGAHDVRCVSVHLCHTQTPARVRRSNSSTQQCSREHWLIRCQQPASSRASRWLGNSPEPFLVPLPTAVALSRDTGARLSLSGCFPACQASHVGSCCDFPDGCLAPSSSPSGWTSSWSTRLGQHISLAPALPFYLRALASESLPSAGQLPAWVI